MCLDTRPLAGSALLPTRDLVLLHLTFHSISPGFIFGIEGLRVGEATNELIPVDITIVFMALQFWVGETNFRGSHCNGSWGVGWLIYSKEAFVLFKKEIVPQQIEDGR